MGIAKYYEDIIEANEELYELKCRKVKTYDNYAYASQRDKTELLEKKKRIDFSTDRTRKYRL